MYVSIRIEKYYKSFKLINKSITNDFDNIVITIISKLLITFKILDNIMLIKTRGQKYFRYYIITLITYKNYIYM